MREAGPEGNEMQGWLKLPVFIAALACGLATLLGSEVRAQQFNSDSWLSKEPGVATVILTGGERNSTVLTTFSLLPRWEFTTGGFLYDNDEDPSTNDGYSLTLYAKYMFFENKAKTGGAAVKFGTGVRPGEAAELGAPDQGAFRTFWMNLPVTLPLFNNKLSIDLMPGASLTSDFGDRGEGAWGFTYSGRVAWYPRNPQWSLVGEVFGTSGEANAIPEYKVGLRWEPSSHTVWALTYGEEFNGDGTNDARLELGLMIFTPPFFCIRGCK